MTMNDKDRLQARVNAIATAVNDGYLVEADEVKYYDNDYEEGDMLSAFDYLRDMLDSEYIISADRHYKGARILVAFGGPNIWINTHSKTIEGYWWGDTATADYYDDPMGIDDCMAELYEGGMEP